MAVSIEDIKKLRHMTGAGMMDCKNALAETEGDIQAAIEIIRKKGQAVAAKREDRNAAEGCVFSGTNGNFAAIATLKCETDFVAKNESFRALARKVLALALANKCKSVDELKAVQVEGRTLAELITDEIGKTGEKMELGDYEWIEAASVASYNHFNDKLAAIVGFNLEGVDAQVGREVCMQIASMNPVAVSGNDRPGDQRRYREDQAGAGGEGSGSRPQKGRPQPQPFRLRRPHREQRLQGLDHSRRG